MVQINQSTLRGEKVKLDLNLELTEVDCAVATIRSLTKAMADAEAQIAECHKRQTLAEEMLAALMAQAKTATNDEDLKARKKACRLSIKAWKLSLVAYQSDIDTCRMDINDIVMRYPEARMDN